MSENVPFCLLAIELSWFWQLMVTMTPISWNGLLAFTPSNPKLKVPHMGWNDLVLNAPHPVFDGIATGDHAYFVHSYQVRVDTAADRLAHVEYSGDVTAVIGRATMVGTQFHPEKSQATGLRMIANFLRWRP